MIASAPCGRVIKHTLVHGWCVLSYTPAGESFDSPAFSLLEELGEGLEGGGTHSLIVRHLEDTESLFDIRDRSLGIIRIPMNILRLELHQLLRDTEGHLDLVLPLPISESLIGDGPVLGADQLLYHVLPPLLQLHLPRFTRSYHILQLGQLLLKLRDDLLSGNTDVHVQSPIEAMKYVNRTLSATSTLP